MHAVLIETFSMRDIMKPEPGRIKMILSGIINFAKFREELLPGFERLCEVSAT